MGLVCNEGAFHNIFACSKVKAGQQAHHATGSDVQVLYSMSRPPAGSPACMLVKGRTTRKVKGDGGSHFALARYFFGTIWCARILFALHECFF